MATGGGSDGANNSVDKLFCAICLEKYCRPKILACYHSFCQQCLQDLVGTSSSFPCPSCRKIMILPPGGVSALQTNFYIEDDTDTKSLSPSTPRCDACTKEEATHTCLLCQQRYCLPCRTVHDSRPLGRYHAVISLKDVEQMSSGVGSGPSHTARQKQTQKTCPKHSTGTSHESPSASGCASNREKKPPQIILTKDCCLRDCDIYPISKSRVWIYYTLDYLRYHLKLFDAQGQMLVDKRDMEGKKRIVNMEDDNILLFDSDDSHGLMISSDGQESSVNLGFDAYNFKITSGVQCGHHYITRGHTVHYGKVTLSGDQVTYSQDRVVFNEIPEDCLLLHVSVDEQYFAFDTDYEVRVYTKTDFGVPQPLFSYITKYYVLSACFCKIEERELLLVITVYDNKVHVVDHKDGGRFVCYLDTGTVDLVNPFDLSTDYDKHVWIRCIGEGVVVVHLSADCGCEEFSVCSLPTGSTLSRVRKEFCHII